MARGRGLPWFPGVVLAALVFTALFASSLAPHSPTDGDITRKLIPPVWMERGDWEHPLGTDRFGRDVLSRLIFGSQISLAVSLIAIGVAGTAGTALGLIAGYRGGLTDAVLMRLTDIGLSLPTILIAVVLVAVSEPSFRNVVLVIALLLWPRFARQMRGETLAIKQHDFVALAVVAGRSSTWIIRRHIFPNVVPTLLVISTLQVGYVILLEGSLSFLGVGVPPPSPAWGLMIADGRGFLATAWWISLFPGLAMLLTVLAVNLMGDWLRDHLDPKLRQLGSRAAVRESPVTPEPAAVRPETPNRENRECPMHKNRLGIFLLGVVLLYGWSGPAGAHSDEPKLRVTTEHPQQGSDSFRIVTVSAKNHLVSGGDVLVRIDVAGGIPLGDVRVERNGQDVSAAFKPAAGAHSLLGLVAGLDVGDNVLAVRQAGARKGPGTHVRVTNYPIAGPIVSGPHEQPFFCTTQTFVVPVIGGTLGAPLDADCSIATRVDYVYRSASTFKPLNRSLPMPADVAMTTTSARRTVPYIVRMETGTINRAIYQTSILHNPYTEPTPDPFNHPAGWNGKVIYTHGGGCRSGWYFQGNGTGGALDVFMLSQGYGLATSSLNVFGNNCNDLLAAETTMMVKERFIEAYGPPIFTMGWGSSGGSYQSHQTSDNYPGLFDGIIVGHSFPDVTSATIITLFDSRLLHHYFNDTAPGVFSPEEQRLASGFGQFAEIAELSDQATRLDPAAEFNAAVPASARYDPVTNPTGARSDVIDHTVNVYGRDRETGFARRPMDNVGIQYGLAALNKGQITKSQFLDLNARIGGVDDDFKFIPERTAGDRKAIRLAYQSGRILNGGGGLDTTPILDTRGYTDDDPTGDIHMRVHGFSTRARLVNANGDADNQVMWVGTGAVLDLSSTRPPLQDAIRQMDRWLTNLFSDASSNPLGVKVRRAKPGDLLDACFTATGSKIVEPQTFDGPGVCNTLFPSFPSPRMVAGAPLADDIMKCQLKPVDPADYAVLFTTGELKQLEEIFPHGVCDWSKRGVEQRRLKGTWLQVEVGEGEDD